MRRAGARAGLGVVAAIAAVVAAGGGAIVAGASCDEAPDFVPFSCAEPVEGTSGDAGADADADAATTVTLTDDDDGGDGGDGGDSGDSGPPTAYFLARQITANDCALAAITWIQCDEGAFARYYAIDGGQLTVDYYQMPSGALLGEVIFPMTDSNGLCTRGPSAFAPPACAGSQVVCCPYAPDAGDGGDDADAPPDSGCGF